MATATKIDQAREIVRLADRILERENAEAWLLEHIDGEERVNVGYTSGLHATYTVKVPRRYLLGTVRSELRTLRAEMKKLAG